MNDDQWDWLDTVLDIRRQPSTASKRNDTTVAVVEPAADVPASSPPVPAKPATPPVQDELGGAPAPVAAGPDDAQKKVETANTSLVTRFNKIKVTYEIREESQAFYAAYKTFDAARKAGEYAKALLLVPDLEKHLTAMEAVAAELPKKQKAADAEAVKVIAMDDSAIKKLSAADKADMVKVLLAAGKPTGDARKAQIKIYKNAELDPAFLKEDEKRGDEIAAELKGDKELKAARKDWKKTSEADKIKILEKVVAVQSKKFGIDPPKIVIEHNPSVVSADGKSKLTTNGYFNPDDGMLHINMDPDSSVHTFQTAVDLALHENAHNWQAHLVKDLQSGKLKSSDPNYQQALMFAVNELEPGGYVDGAEDMAAYQKQPLENHSWTTGPETAKKIMKGL